MSKVRILIIEDEPDLSEDLQFSLEDIGYEVTGIAPDLKEAFGLFYAQDPDLVIVDIMLNGQPDGIAFAERMNENPVRKKPIIFLTGMNDKATFEIAKKTMPSSYLLKPYNIKELQFAIELAVEQFHGGERIFAQTASNAAAMQDSFFIKKQDHLVKVHYSDIQCVSVEGRYSDIYTEEGKYTVRYSLGDMGRKLPTFFMRVHNNYLVNLNQVKNFNTRDNQLLLVGDRYIPVSKRMKEQLMERINLLR